MSAAAAEPAAPPDAVIELWSQKWTLTPGGEMVYRETQNVRLNNERAYHDFADPRITYNEDTDKLTIITARTKRPDGTYRELPDYSHVLVAPDTTSGWPAYAGIRQHLLVMSGLEAGCVVELTYEIATRAGARPYLAADVRIDSRYPIEQRELTVQVPAGKKLSTAFVGISPEQAKGAGPGDSAQMADGRQVKTWTFSKLPGIPDEPLAPPWPAVGKRLAFSTAGPAEEWVHQRLEGLAAAGEPTEAVRKLAEEWTKDVAGPQEKLRALQEHLSKSFNYIEFEPAWRPAARPGGEVLESNYGLPAEAGAALFALAKAAGLSVQPGLLVSVDRWQSAAPQETMIAAYVTCLQLGADPAKADWQIWDAHYGRVQREGRWGGHHLLAAREEIARTARMAPWTDADDSGCEVGGEIAIADDGSYSGQVDVRLTGFCAHSEALRTADDQKSRIKAVLGRVLPEVSVESFAIQTLAAGELAAEVKVKSSKPLKKVGTAWALALPQDGPLVADWRLPLNDSTRAMPVRLAGAGEERITLAIAYPAGWSVVVQPAALEAVSGEWGGVSQSVTAGEQRVTVSRLTRLAQREISAEQLRVLRTPLNTLRSEHARTLVLKPK